MIKIRTIQDKGEGYFDIVYSVQMSGSHTIGTYRLMCKPDGTPYGAGRDYHRLLLDGDQVAPNECLNACQFHGGREAGCDGSSLVPRYVDENERWMEAERMAT